jgi:Skp family chaperone for outer membrane proteins
MIKTWNILILALTLSALSTVATSAQSKIAVIDMKVVFDGYWKTKQASVTFEDRKKDYADQHQKMIDQYQAANEDYRKVRETASEAAISTGEKERRNKSAEEKLKEIQKLEKDIRDHQKSMEGNLTETRFRLRRNILREIQDLINTKSKTEGYTLVLDSASEGINQTPVVLFSNGANDITEDILLKLNETAPIDAAK